MKLLNHLITLMLIFVFDSAISLAKETKSPRYKDLEIEHGEMRKVIYNPSYFYIVSRDGAILEIRDITAKVDYPVTEGTFEVQMYNYKENVRVGSGTWKPNKQQFYSFQVRLKSKVQGRDCVHWKSNRYSLIFEPVKFNVNGKTITGYWDKGIPKRGEVPQICSNAAFKPGTCDIIECNRYTEMKKEFMMVETLEHAKLISSCLKKGGYDLRLSDRTYICK